MNLIRLIHTQVQDRRLPNALIQGRDWRSLVIGNDLNRVRHLAIILNARDANQQDWHSYSLRESAMQKDSRTVMGRDDYRAILSLKRQQMSWNLKRVGASADWLPKSDQLMRQRLAFGHEAHDYSSSMGWLYRKTDQDLEESDIRFLDDPASMRNPRSLPLLSPDIGQYQLVAVVSSGMSRGEATWLAAYLHHDDILAQREVTVVVEDRAAWRDFWNQHGKGLRISEEDLSTYPDEWPRANGRVRLGHVSWPTGTWVEQMKRLRNLLVQILRDGGKASDIRVVTDSVGYAFYIRTELFAMGLPIQCSESELLPANPVALDLMSLITLVRHREHLQALCRLALHIPGESRLDLLRDFFRSDLSEDDFRPFLTDRRAVVSLEAWRELAQHADSHPVQLLHRAGECYEKWAGPNAALRSEEIQEALAQWSEQFDSADDMIQAFWRLRAIISPWSGYRPDSGIRVSGTVPTDCRDIVVLMSAFAPELHPAQFKEIGPDVYHAYIQERNESTHQEVD
ncbi:MAG: hypothetical protein KIS92_03235 [Planctomycetota bacterium]|nr:hypothetical protein [Planctomycetota bacterium]